MDSRSPPSRPPVSLWPVSLAAIVLTLVVGGLIFWALTIRACQETPDHWGAGAMNTLAAPLQRIAAAFRPGVQVSSIAYSSIGQLNNQAKLVVLTADISVDLQKHIHTSILWGYVGLGTTTVELRALDNQVQYIIPLDSLRIQGFTFNPLARQLTLHVPPPVLDTDMVSVQSDPSKIFFQREDTGWSQIDRLRGTFLREEAAKDLRPRVIEEAEHPLLLAQARANARKLLTGRLMELLGPALRPGVTLNVEFDDAAHG